MKQKKEHQKRDDSNENVLQIWKTKKRRIEGNEGEGQGGGTNPPPKENKFSRFAF